MLKALAAGLWIALPTALAAQVPEAAWELRNRGLAELENEAPTAAEPYFRELAEVFPEDPLGSANLGVSLLRQQRTDEALAAIDRALTIAPDRADILVLRATTLAWSGQRETALASFRDAAQADLNNLEVLYALHQHATTLRGDDAEAAAAEALGRLAKLRPDNLYVLLKQIRSAVESRDPTTATAAMLRVEQLLWQAPPLASEQLAALRQALEVNDLDKARTPSILIENVLKAEGMYQRSLDELRTNVLGLPIVRFAVEGRAFQSAEQLAQVFRPTQLDDHPVVGAALATADLNGDGLADRARIVHTESGLRLRVEVSSMPSRDFPIGEARQLEVVDLDNDGFLDLLSTNGTITYLRGDGQGGFSDATRSLGIARVGGASATIDYDVEGDLDLLVQLDGHLELYRNALDGPLVAVGAQALPPSPALPVDQILTSDVDRDGDLDLLLIHPNGLTLWSNLRQGRFSEVESGLESVAGVAPGTRKAAIGDLDNDGWPDLVLFGEAITLWSNQGGRFVNRPRVGDLPAAGAGPTGLLFDADNDGSLDLASVVEGRTQLFRQSASGWRRITTVPVGENRPTPATQEHANSLLATEAVAAADLDDDGDLDLVTAGPNGAVLLDNLGGNQNGWLKVSLQGLAIGSGKNNRFGIGATLELIAGDQVVFREVNEPVTHLGLGSRDCAEVLRVVWTNGVPQNLVAPCGRQSILEEQVLKGSCPFLYTHTENGIEFVTDLLWGAPLGMPVGIDRWAGFDPDELVEVRGAVPVDGVWDLRITEELWEAAWFDRTRLWIVDHPANLEVTSSLRIVPGESTPDRVLASADVRSVVAAWDGRGVDVTQIVAHRDGTYADGFPKGRYQGVTAEPWTFTFDLGTAPGSAIRLLLDGWIFPADASLNIAVDQRTTSPTLTRLEVETQNGWQVLMPNMGHPAGKTKPMAIDTPALPEGASRLRIVTSNWLSWDRIAWSLAPRDSAIVVVDRRAPSTAVLAYRGFSRLLRNTPNAPHSFDYSTVREASPWLPFAGNYTRFGDVRELLLENDDRSVILAPGDEIRLTFDAGGLPPLAEGWTRTLFLESRGYDKDADRNTWQPNHLEPLPFSAMTGYPYGPGENFPDTPELRLYQREWLTREVHAEPQVTPSSGP